MSNLSVPQTFYDKNLLLMDEINGSSRTMCVRVCVCVQSAIVEAIHFDLSPMDSL